MVMVVIRAIRLIYYSIFVFCLLCSFFFRHCVLHPLQILTSLTTCNIIEKKCRLIYLLLTIKHWKLPGVILLFMYWVPSVFFHQKQVIENKKMGCFKYPRWGLHSSRGRRGREIPHHYWGQQSQSEFVSLKNYFKMQGAGYA